jgi:hypothetical protein
MQTLKFNTGREYTEHGQRIVATQLDTGNIVLVDLDRHMDLMLRAGVDFNQADIMQAYDHSWYVFPEDIGLSYSAYYDIVRQLRDA